jgi:chromate reductase, NAD(P)H dehydrogenase (quinone)
VTSFKDKIAAADGLLIVTPEYNGGIPGVTKNAIDWMTRPPADIPRVFGGKPTGLVGATPGPAGTRLSQTAWLPVFRALGVVPYFGHLLYVDGAAKVFDAEGAIIDDKVRERAKKYVAGFLGFVEKMKA